MTNNPESEVSEAQIAVHWREEDYYQPPQQFVAQANAADLHLRAILGDKFPECFADMISSPGMKDGTTLDIDSSGGGSLVANNASYNCVDGTRRRGRTRPR
jgi:acetyl-CoA synthetase